MRRALLVAAILTSLAAPLRAEDTQPPLTLHFGGRLQTYYEALVPDHSNGDPISDTSQFRIRRARFVVDGHVYDPSLTYEVQLEMAGSSATLKRAYFNWRSSDALQFRAGRFKTPFGRQWITPWYKQQLTDRSLASSEFTRGDDDGVMIWGTPREGRFEYYLGVFNGDGQNRNSQQDNRNQWFARAVWSPRGKFAYSESALGAAKTPRWSFGVDAGRNGGWLFDVNGKPGIQAPARTCTATACTVDHGDDASLVTAGIDATMTWDRFSSTAETFERSVDARQHGVPAAKSRGWYAQSGWFVQRDKTEIGARYGTAVHTTERALFVNRYIRGHDYKVQTELAEIARDRRLRIQLVISF